MVVYILIQPPITLLIIISLVGWLLLLLASYSYAFKKQLFKVQQWKYILWFQVAYIFFSTLMSLNILDTNTLGFLGSQTQATTGSTELLGFVLIIPALISLYRLSNSNSKISKKR